MSQVTATFSLFCRKTVDTGSTGTQQVGLRAFSNDYTAIYDDQTIKSYIKDIYKNILYLQYLTLNKT